MQGHLRKLAHSLDISLDVARTLMLAGYDTPKKARMAKQADLVSLAGIGPATAQKIRGE